MFKSLCVYRKKYAEKEKLKWGLQSIYLAWLSIWLDFMAFRSYFIGYVYGDVMVGFNRPYMDD
jgi:hypothetical protein